MHPSPDSAPSGAEELLKIGDFAKLAGTNLRTLRYYEEMGILHPAARSPGGFRFYRRADLDRLAMVANLQRLGLELARIRELMDTRDGERARPDFVARVRAALTEQVALVDRRVQELADQRLQLVQAMKKLDQCISCGHQPEEKNRFCHPCQVDGRDLPIALSALF